ncbi:MAG: N-acetylneuraminate synthase family protein [Candidatus Thorarchaeota archaeon]
MVKKLIIFEMANNHGGSFEKGLEIIHSFYKLSREFPNFNFAFKFQYRNLDTFIHPDYQDRYDIKYVNRFKATALSDGEFVGMINVCRYLGFTTICTGFDEESVDKIVEQKFDYIKVASCSFTDWPLLNHIAKYDLPIIASTGGAVLDEIQNVYDFFINRGKNISLMHCVGEYPTSLENYYLKGIKDLKELFPGAEIGLSTHERYSVTDTFAFASYLGASIFEKHVCIDTVNSYSVTPPEMERCLHALSEAETKYGEGPKTVSLQEEIDLRQFKRGVFAKRNIRKGEYVTRDDVFYAFPCQESQLLANDMGKYASIKAEKNFEINGAIKFGEIEYKDNKDTLLYFVNNIVKDVIRPSGVVIPPKSKIELSHHYGLERFQDVGLTLITVINDAYCKKLLVSLPYQSHPVQWHKKKTETFHVLYGSIDATLNGELFHMEQGDMLTILPGSKHAFVAGHNGAVIEEISTTYYKNDSFYENDEINQNKNRKTVIDFWDKV